MGMTLVDVYGYLDEMNEKIEQEIQEKFPDRITLNFPTLMTLDSFADLYFTARCAGLEVVYTDNGLVLNNGEVKLKVPKTSELYFKASPDSDNVKLQGRSFAKIAKEELLYIFSNFYIRYCNVDESSFNIRFKFIGHDENIEYSVFKSLLGKSDHIKLHQKNLELVSGLNENDRKLFIDKTHEISTLFWYGIFIKLPDDLSWEEIANDDTIVSLDVTISVPESSEFSTGNGPEGEIAGENAYNFAVETLENIGFKSIGGKTLNFNYIIREGDRWDKQKQQASAKFTDALEETYKTPFQ